MFPSHPRRPSQGRQVPLTLVGLILVLATSLAGVGCGGSAAETTPGGPQDGSGAAAASTEAAASYPEDTVFTLGGVPVLLSDIDAYVPLIRLIDPHLVTSSLRRNALANVVLPITASRALDPEAREEAFQRAQAYNAHARENGDVPPGTPEPRYLTGTWKDVGLVPFAEAMSMTPGSYSRLVESPAAWTFFKLIATNVEEGAEFEAMTEITIQRYDIPYLPDEASRELVQQAIDTFPVEVIDEEWEHIIPPIVIYKPKAD
ncbi:MAG: hypothetical protein AAGG01_14605, partial [Planctomycetota bacterium]